MTLLQGLLIGFLYALVPGGTMLMGLRLSTARGFARSVPFSYGVLPVDILYGLVAVGVADAGADAYARTAVAWASMLPAAQLLLVFILVGYGAFLILRPPAPSRDTGMRRRQALSHPFTIGVGLKLATAVSPSFLAGLALLTAEAGALGLPGWGTADRLLFAAGYGLGNFVFLLACMAIAARSVRDAGRRPLLLLRRGIGTAFAALGIALLCHTL